MTREFRRIHALNASYPIAEISGVGHEHAVFKDVGAPAHPIKEEICTDIPDRFIITKVALPRIAAQYLDRLQAGGSLVLHMHKFKVPVTVDFHPHPYPVTRMKELVILDRLK